MARVTVREQGELRVDAAAVERARLLHGATQMSCLVGTRDKRQVRLAGGGVVGFRVAAGVAVVAGDPLAPPPLRAAAVREFVALCGAMRRQPCFVQTSPALRGAYRAAGLRVFGFGAEALVDLPAFTLDVPSRANLRHEVAHAHRIGLGAQTMDWADVPDCLWDELRAVSDAWLAERPWRELGFSLGRFGETVDARGLLTVVRDVQGGAQAFTSWLRLDHGIALDMFRRRPHAPPGAMDLCITATLEAGRHRGLQVASLGVAPFRDTGAEAGGRIAASIRGWLFRHGSFGYDYRSLARFKGKFAPRWEPRDIAVPRGPGALLVPVALALVHFTAPSQRDQRGHRQPRRR
jgi:phosphatidylglycerol lysyltransferase